MNKKAQSIVEYTLVLGAIIAIVATVMFARDVGIRDRTRQIYNRTSDVVNQTRAHVEGKGVFNLSGGGGGGGVPPGQNE